MALVVKSPEDYTHALQGLLPFGPAWPREPEAVLTKLLEAWAIELSRVDNTANELLEDIYPNTTTSLLPDWERVTGMPNFCLTLGNTIVERRQDVLAILTSRGGQSPQYFIDVAAKLGYTITITEFLFDPFRVGISAVGDALNGESGVYVWQVNSQLNTVQFFRVGFSGTGDALASWSNDRLECIINKFKPAHTLVLFSYT